MSYAKLQAIDLVMDLKTDKISVTVTLSNEDGGY